MQAVVDAISQEPLERTVRTLAAFPTRHTLSGANGVDAAADWLYREFQGISRESGGRLQVEKDTWVQPAGRRLEADTPMTNVVATLPGTETPERIVVVSGHYDSRVTDVMDAKSRAPGANDDASGVAVVLELARQMARHSYPCTVVFAAVTGEEQGLYGSTHMAQTFAEQKKQVIAMFTNDIVGNSRGENGVRENRRLRVFSAGYDPTETPGEASRRRAWGTDAETASRTLARAAADAVRRYLRGFELALVYRNDRYGRGGDHTPFVAQGYAACRFTEMNEDWRHQHQDLRTENGVVYGDLPEYVDYAYLKRVAQANAAIVAELASAPPSPARVLLKGDLSPNTTLTWRKGEGATPSAGYEVLWRKTTAADWEGKKVLDAAATSVVLPLSKDDYLFAVRAVGQNGARSLPTIPVGGGG
ncbi:MAG: M20/M25/M40 family metallo-hydrolase [Armatimonadaceae bacterium]